MPSVDSKWCPFIADFTFWNKKMSRGPRSGEHHCNAFGCQKLRSTAHPDVAVWDSWAPSWHKIFSSPVLKSVSNELFPGSCSLHQQSFWLLIFDPIEQVLSPVLCCHLSVLLMVVRCASVSIKRTVTRFMFTSPAVILTVNLRSDRTNSRTHAVLSPVHVVDGRPLRYSSSSRILPSKKHFFFCQRKACAFDIASSPKACRSFPYVLVALSPSLTQKEEMAYRCAMFRASIFMTRFTNASWHVKHLLHTKAFHSHATASGNGGRTKVKGCPC